MTMKTIVRGEKSALRDVIVSLENGSRPKGGVRSIRNGVPSIGAEHLDRDGGFAFSEARFIPRAFYDSLSRGKIAYEDILIVKDGATTGKVAFVDKDFPYEEAAVNEHVFILRANKQKILPLFLFFYLFSEQGQIQIDRNFHGSAQGGINTTFIDNFWIPIPPMKEQFQVVDLLLRSQRLKQRRRQANLLALRVLQAVFLNMFGDPATNPKKWNTKNLESLLVTKLRHGYSLERARVNDSSIGIPVLKLSALNDYGFDSSKIKFYDDTLQNVSDSILRKNDILISRSNTLELVGRVGRYDGNPQPCIFPDLMIRIQANPEMVEPSYLESYLRTSYVREYFRKRARGTSGSMPKISNVDICEIDVCVPPIELQNKFASIVAIAEQLKQRQRHSSEEIVSLQNSIMSKAFKGELVTETQTLS